MGGIAGNGRLNRTVLGPLACAAALLSACGSSSESPDPASAAWQSAPVVPRIDGELAQAARKTLRRGSARGNRRTVFAKLGDSLTQAPAFLQQAGCGPLPDSAPASTVSLFRRTSLPGGSAECGRVNSFSRNSASALVFRPAVWAVESGGSTDPECRPSETPLACEVRLIRPSYALVLFGTNDVTIMAAAGGDSSEDYLQAMASITRELRRRGVVPILTTIPPRTDDADAERLTELFNAGLVRLASEMRVPLINLWRALEPLPNHGISSDDLHLSLYGGPECTGLCDPRACSPACSSVEFGPEGLRYGYNKRNLVTIRALRRLERLARNKGE